VHEETLKEIVDELNELLPGRFLGRIFQLSPLSLVIDFGLREKGYLFINVEPAAPRLYLIERSQRELEKAAVPLSSFAQVVRTTLAGGGLLSLTRDEGERVVRFSFAVTDEFGDLHRYSLVKSLLA
jgi:predicted ribosome quality control (RQC) complex YloA/Tae2 family protein